MTVVEWLTALRAALEPSQPDELSRDGKTRYELLAETLLQLSSHGEADSFLDAFLEAAESGPGEDVEWWSRLFNLLESFKQLDQQGRLRLTTFFEPERGFPAEVRAMILRQLAMIGCRLDWEAIRAQRTFNQAIMAKPLFIADAYVWAGKLEEAASVVKQAIADNRIGQRHAERMLQRWNDRGAEVRITLAAEANLVAEVPTQWLVDVPLRFDRVTDSFAAAA